MQACKRRLNPPLALAFVSMFAHAAFGATCVGFEHSVASALPEAYRLSSEIEFIW